MSMRFSAATLSLLCFVHCQCGVEHSTGDADAQLRDADRLDASQQDTTPSPWCRFEGQANQQLGDDCGCAQDCSREAPRCERNPMVELLGSSYCTSSCDTDSACAAGFECYSGIPMLGLSAFCQRCGSDQPASVGLDEPCICEQDCAQVNVDGRQRELSCIDGLCLISPCGYAGASRCPSGYTCESVGDNQNACIRCLNDNPGEDGTACACSIDCKIGLECLNNVCRKRCDSDEDCSAEQECRLQVTGGALCTDVPESCQGLGDHVIGELCNCNTDCSAEAPDCLTLEVWGQNAAVCTIRPCDTNSVEACPASATSAFVCCEVPALFAATCIPEMLAAIASDYAICSQ